MSIAEQLALIEKARAADLTTEKGRAELAQAMKLLPGLVKQGHAEGLRRYTLVRLPSGLYWAFLGVWLLTATLQGSVALLRMLEPETDATAECREVVKGSLGWELSSGVLCVRPVHFIENKEITQ